MLKHKRNKGAAGYGLVGKDGEIRIPPHLLLRFQCSSLTGVVVVRGEREMMKWGVVVVVVLNIYLMVDWAHTRHSSPQNKVAGTW